MWNMIAFSKIYYNLNYSYQVKIFQDMDGDTDDPVEFQILNEMKLVRGSSSPKNEFVYFIPTYIEIQILDMDMILTKKIQALSEKKVQAIIYRNNEIFFRGNIISLLQKRNFISSSSVVPFKIYDGISRLRDFDDLSVLPDTTMSMGEFVRQIINKLELELDYKFYLNMYPTPHNVAIAPVASVGLKLIDIVNQDSNITYYDILEKLLKQFALSLFQENGTWIIRQDISLNHIGTAVSNMNYSTGIITETSVIPVQNISDENLQYSPQLLFLDPITKLILRVESKSPKKDAGDIGWKNEHFREGSRGWTVEPNTIVEFNNESMRFFNSLTSGRVYQTTTHQFSPAEIPIIKFVCLTSRFMTSAIDEGSYPFVSVKYRNDLDIDFWLKEDGTWQQSTPNYFVAYQERRYIENISNYEYIQGYNTVILEREIEAPITLDMGYGYITVYLYGGGIPNYNHPYEITAQHILSSVRRKCSDDNISTTADSLDVTSSISQENELIVNLPMHDEDPFITPALYNLYDGSKTRLWMPENKSLLEYLSQELIRYMTHNIEVLDVKLIPNNQYDFTTLKKGDLTGSEMYYLPVYEEAKLLADDRRFILAERTRKSLTIKTTKEYIVSV